MNFQIRTDLALETREIYQKAQNIENEVPGVETKIDDSDNDFLFTEVNILSDEGASLLNKPIGNYITIESKYMNDEVESIDKKIINKLASTIKDISHIVKKDSVLVVGLGNSDVTPDAIGPKVVDNLSITRHLIEYAPELVNENTRAVSAIVPGVLGTTGIETSDIVKGIVEKTKPDLVIVVDALAAKDMNRISRTIQVSNTGITPGSGVKNNRFSLTRESLGVPVIAVGVPTVVGVPTIVNEAIEYVSEKIPDVKTPLENENYMQNILENKDFDFMVTPNDIDDIISNISRLVSEGINSALHE
jgi:spore protease